jgi:hypothetical protein
LLDVLDKYRSLSTSDQSVSSSTISASKSLAGNTNDMNNVLKRQKPIKKGIISCGETT